MCFSLFSVCQTINPCRLSCCCFAVKLLPLCCSGFLFVCVIIVNIVIYDYFVTFSFEAVMDLYSTRVEKETKSFFESKLDFMKSLQYDLESGNYDDQDYGAYEQYFYSRFRQDDSIQAFYSILSNYQTYKLHRETPGYLSTQIRTYVNDSYQYRFDRRRRHEENDFSNYIQTESLVKSYKPFGKKWFEGGTESYPNGYWEGPVFSSSSDSSVLGESQDAPIFVFVQKFVWRNSSRFSVHKVKFATSSVKSLMESIYEDESAEKIDFALISSDHKVMSYRSVEDQLTEDGEDFRKLWEIEKDYFKDLNEDILSKAISNKKMGFAEDLDNDISSNFVVTPLGSDSNDWTLVLYVSRNNYFSNLITGFAISLVISIIVLLLYLCVLCVTSCTMGLMWCSEQRKRKTVKIVKKLNKRLNKEREDMNNLIHALVPPPIAVLLRDKSSNKGKSLWGRRSMKRFSLKSMVFESEAVTVFFLDVAGFTKLTQSVGPVDLVRTLRWIFHAIDHCGEKYNIYKIKTIGDCYMGCRGIKELEKSVSVGSNPVLEVLEACTSMIRFLREKGDPTSYDDEDSEDVSTMSSGYEKDDDIAENLKKVNYRVGLHVGRCVYGIIERKSARFDLWGNAVNFASRLESNGRVGSVHFSKEVYDELSETDLNKFLIEEHEVELKGFDGVQKTYLSPGFSLVGTKTVYSEVVPILDIGFDLSSEK